MNVNRRLFQYAALYKRNIVLAFVLLALAVTTELTGPFVAKELIDQHVIGIQKTWYETDAKGPNVVYYQGHDYKREDYFSPGEPHGHPISIIQVGRTFYFVNEALPYMQNPIVHDGKLTVYNQTNRESISVPVDPLTAQELFKFYSPEIPYMWKLALLYFGLLVVSSGFSYGERYLLQLSANRILQTMRQQVFHQIHRLPIRYFDSMPAGKIVSRITNDTEAIKDFYVSVLANFLSSFIRMFGIYVALFLLDVRLALICCLLIPIVFLWMSLYRKYAVTINHRIRAILSDINGMINETIQGIAVIRVFNRQKKAYEEFEALNQAYFQGQIKLLKINAATGYNLVSVLRNVFFIALLAYFGYRFFQWPGAISFGALYAFVDYLGRLFQPLGQLVSQLSNLESARVSAERVFALLDESGEEPAEGTMARYKGNVCFDHVTFSYDGKKDVLKDISFTVEQGQTIALVGHTGSGKSSIMNLLFRFYDPRFGKITIDGIDIATIPRQHLRKHMGIVLQDPFLFSGTIASNISLGDPDIRRERIEEALRDVGADRLFGHLPQGWDEPVIEKGSTLSAGQRQLISFARALAFNPAILVLDEATSSIDTETEAVIQEALNVLKRGRTTFVIAHRLSTIRYADQILVLDRGSIVERGSHDELMELRGRYYQMYQLQQGNIKNTG